MLRLLLRAPFAGILIGMLSVFAIVPCAYAFDPAQIAARVLPPYQLGESEGGREGIWALLDSGGGHAGWVIRSRPLAPLPGFAGEPMDLLITLDREGRFLDVSILEQHEPVFLSGLGTAPFEAFLDQYRGRTVGDSLTVGSPASDAHHEAASHTYLDGVSKATASVRIANETILAAARTAVRDRLGGAVAAPARPLPEYREMLDWSSMVAKTILQRLVLADGDVERAFAASIWEADTAVAAADPGAPYLDLWLVDVGPPSVAQALLDAKTLATLARVLMPDEEPILILANGRHRLVDEDFVRNSTPDRISASQNGFPLALRHADVEVGLAPGLPAFQQALLLRIDRRLGFDPASAWTFSLRVVREHGSFRPERGGRDFVLAYTPQPRFYETVAASTPTNPVLAAVTDRATMLFFATAGVIALGWALLRRSTGLARLANYPRIRLATLATVIVVIGFWGQAQLSIVTPLAVWAAIGNGQDLAFLLYDPLSLVLWIATLISLVIWGRGFFCGWLCPYGAMQEVFHRIGRWLAIPEFRVPAHLDRPLKVVKYVVLAALMFAAIVSATATSTLVEVEPFKTAITLGFRREVAFVVYAVAWLVLSLFVFKPFCRYVCPLGAMLAVAGRARRWDWIPRRAVCGTPCQFCRVRCDYGAIAQSGAIDYTECFQCLDCVRIEATPALCVADRLAQKKGRHLSRRAAA